MKPLRALWGALDRWLFSYFDHRPELATRGADDLRQALNFGTTLTTRLWLSLFSLSAAAQLILQPTEPALRGRVFFWELTNYAWAGSLLGAGFLMLWRTMTPRSRPAWGWISNGWMASVWGCMVWSKVLHEGAVGLLGYFTFVWIMAAWVFIRTGATRRDMETT